MARKSSKSHKFHWLVGVLFLVTLIILLSIGRRGFYRQFLIAQEKKRLEREIVALKEELKRLEEEIEKLKDPEYVEKIAREKYGMAKKNEKVYRVVPQQKEK
jgi:cell division protein FtsL